MLSKKYWNATTNCYNSGRIISWVYKKTNFRNSISLNSFIISGEFILYFFDNHTLTFKLFLDISKQESLAKLTLIVLVRNKTNTYKHKYLVFIFILQKYQHSPQQFQYVIMLIKNLFIFGEELTTNLVFSID